jgi:cardiolipin synthase
MSFPSSLAPARSQAALLLAILFALFVTGCTSTRRLLKPLPPTVAVRTPEFGQAIGSLLGANLLPGNRITTLNDGDEIFPAMLSAIRGAKKTITFETYIFSNGQIAQEFTNALCERARAGVEVKMIVDAFGARAAGNLYSELRKGGVQLALYHPFFSRDFWHLTYRTHRKLLVVDGRVGFIGGVGIGDEWRGHAKDETEWRELHYRVQGPAVAQMQAAFNSNWFKEREEVLFGPNYFPAQPSAGSVSAGVFHSAPRHGRYSVGLMYHLAISSARESLLIENPYFVPDKALTQALCNAALRGVKVQIIMPGPHTDAALVRLASRARWKPLRAAGVELFEFRHTMMHSKLLVADDMFVSVGSANFDPRSLALNDEANLIVMDPNFAAEQTRIFHRDLKNSYRVKPGTFSPRAISLPLHWLRILLEDQL